MHVSYDRETDAAYIYIRDPGDRTGTVESIPLEDAPGVVVVDFDTDGCLFGIEVLDASKFLPAELLVERRSLTADADINAIWARIVEALHDITKQARAPADAARELDRLYVEVSKIKAALRPFVGLAAGWDYDANRRDETERTIVSAAESLRRELEL
ncbi:MAG TPA: DUF2283 domain-containing protein [Gaiellaceae bacterium]|jgi:uncharacterized protein YuzE|nr:DUF2283 domain-containing protein [Gaiellaceae bacterium]